MYLNIILYKNNILNINEFICKKHEALPHQQKNHIAQYQIYDEYKWGMDISNLYNENIFD